MASAPAPSSVVLPTLVKTLDGSEPSREFSQGGPMDIIRVIAVLAVIGVIIAAYVERL
ncbi:MAG: hypothetical protein VX405_07940 [Myxococcota bacterium]|nr:hypothetical protein [Myxococcota bacterium]